MIMTILLSSERIDRARPVEAGVFDIADHLLCVAPPANECTVQPAARRV